MVLPYREYVRQRTIGVLLVDLALVCAFGLFYYHYLGPEAAGWVMIGVGLMGFGLWFSGAWLRMQRDIRAERRERLWRSDLSQAITLAKMGDDYFIDAAFAQSGLHSRVWILVKEGIERGYLEKDGL